MEADQLRYELEILSSGKFLNKAVSLRNRPFPSSLVPLFQNESNCKTFHMKMSSACSFIFTQIKLIFIGMVEHLDWLSNKGTRELGNGLFKGSLLKECREYKVEIVVQSRTACNI